MIFGVPAEQQQCATSLFPLSTEQFFPVSGNVKHGVDPERSDYKTRSGSRAE